MPDIVFLVAAPGRSQAPPPRLAAATLRTVTRAKQVGRVRWNLALWRAQRRLADDVRYFVQVPETGALLCDQPLRFTSLAAGTDAGACVVLVGDGGVRYLKGAPGAYPVPAGTPLDWGWAASHARQTMSPGRALVVGVATPGPARFEAR